MRLQAATFLFVILAPCFVSPTSKTCAAVIVLANRSVQEIPFFVVPLAGERKQYTIASGDVVPAPVSASAEVVFLSNDERKSYHIEPNSVCYFFDTPEGGLELQQIGLGAPFDGDSAEAAAELKAAADDDGESTVTVPVKILVDDDEPANRKVWEARLRDRVEKASEILKKHCRIELEVVEVDTWDSDDSIRSFEKSLREFESEVTPGAARIAIGFTSQYKDQTGPTHLGGTRGPFHPYILTREWSQHVSEPERLEVLVHELGHYFGAVHSPEPTSAMRPKLGDRQALSKKFRIGYDPVTTLVVYLVGEEMRNRKIRQLSQMSRPTKLRLREVYSQLMQTLPGDTAPSFYIARLGRLDAKPKLTNPAARIIVPPRENDPSRRVNRLLPTP